MTPDPTQRDRMQRRHLDVGAGKNVKRLIKYPLNIREAILRAVTMMPRRLQRILEGLGRGISIGRRKRRIPVSLMLERTGLSKRTYQMVERGDPRVAMAAYAMSLHALGLSHELERLADPRFDDAGQLLDEASLPKRIRMPRAKAQT